MQTQVTRSTSSRRRVPTLPPELCAISMTVATASVTALRQMVSTFAGDALQFIRLEPSEQAARTHIVVCVTKALAEPLAEQLAGAFHDLEIGRRADVILRSPRRDGNIAS